MPVPNRLLPRRLAVDGHAPEQVRHGGIVEPARHPTFHYSRDWLRGQFARLGDARNPDFTVGMKLNLPPSYALIHRVWLGSIGVLAQLDAIVPMRAELERWVPGFLPEES